MLARFIQKDTLKETQISISAQSLIVKLLTVQIKGPKTQFSIPLYLPPGQKSAAYLGTLTTDGE